MKPTEEQIEQQFDNTFDCYTDAFSEKAEQILEYPAMTKQGCMNLVKWALLKQEEETR